MSRIDQKFEVLRANGRKAFVPFITVGDPDLESSLRIGLELVRSGADILELGVPFSDPIADGPTIQASSLRALKNGTTLTDVHDVARRLRTATEVPIVVFSYFNPVLIHGLERFAADAAYAGVDGVLITDIVDAEALSFSSVLADRGIDLISLIAPTTSDARLEKIAAGAKGFLYAVSQTGVTGAREESSGAAADLVKRARRFTDIPIVVGFGISTSAQIDYVWKFADGAVVGSAIVREIERSIENGNAVESVRRFVEQLKPLVAKDAVEI